LIYSIIEIEIENIIEIEYSNNLISSYLCFIIPLINRYIDKDKLNCEIIIFRGLGNNALLETPL